MSAPLVGIVIVSHSAQLADGVVELAMQMAPGVPVVAAGGDAEGRLGTDAARVADAVRHADSGAGVVIFVDLGSACLAAEFALEEILSLNEAHNVRICPAPLVEGAVVAAVHSSAGGALEEVEAEARKANGLTKGRLKQ